MNKEQIIKRMNPIQLTKLTGPKTKVADNIKQYPLTPDEVPESIEAKLGFIDFHQTPPEFIDGKEFSRIDGPLNNVVCKSTGPNEYTYEGPIKEIIELKVRINEEAEQSKPHVSLPRTKKKKRRR